jgi:hypothetical protein
MTTQTHVVSGSPVTASSIQEGGLALSQIVGACEIVAIPPIDVRIPNKHLPLEIVPFANTIGSRGTLHDYLKYRYQD